MTKKGGGGLTTDLMSSTKVCFVLKDAKMFQSSINKYLKVVTGW